MTFRLFLCVGYCNCEAMSIRVHLSFFFFFFPLVFFNYGFLRVDGWDEGLGGRYKKGRDYECIWLIHFTVQQELIQCCKAIMKEEVKVTQSCPTLCDAMDCSPPGSSVHGILQAVILEWVADPFSRGSSQLNSKK